MLYSQQAVPQTVLKFTVTGIPSTPSVKTAQISNILMSSITSRKEHSKDTLATTKIELISTKLKV